MKKLIIILCVLVCVLGSFVILKTVNTNIIKEFLDSKYPNETFTIKSVDINVKKMEIITHIYDSNGIKSTIRKKGGVVYSDYEIDKATYLIENELTEVLRNSERLQYIKYMDVKILERIEYGEIANDLNPVIYLTIEYNDKINGKRNFAQISYDVICVINKSKYKNIGTYVFYQNTEYDAMNLVINSEDSESNFDIILNKVELVKENKVE